MLKMRVMIIDDEQMAIDVLERALQQIPQIEIVGTYLEPIKLLNDIGKIPVEVIFIDMEMNYMHGLELAELISKDMPQIEIVFVTAHPQFALEAFEVNAIDYLLKPVQSNRLLKTIDKLQHRIASDKQRIKKHANGEGSLTMRVLGNFQLFDEDGEEVKWRTKKTKELFLYLWHHQKKGVHRSQIIFDLWPEVLEDKATSLLHTTIYQLRKLMRTFGYDQAVTLSNERYTLNTPIKTDVEELLAIISSETFAVEKVEQANDLYKGDYLEVESYEWALAEQENIKTLYLNYLENFLRTGEAGIIVEMCLKKMIDLEPYQTSYITDLLDYYNQTKNMGKLIGLLQETENKWEEELGLPLPAEIMQMYRK